MIQYSWAFVLAFIKLSQVFLGGELGLILENYFPLMEGPENNAISWLNEAIVRGLPWGPRPRCLGSCSPSPDSQWTELRCLKREDGIASHANNT